MKKLLIISAISIGVASWGLTATSKSALETRVTIQAKNVPLKALLDKISSQSHLKFIVDPKIESTKVTVSVKNSPLRKLLDALRAWGIQFKEKDGKKNIYTVQ